MAGCGQCPDQCTCVIVDDNGVQYDGAGSALDPIVIPRARNTPWEGTSDDGSITITPGDVVDPDDDGHAPDFAVNFCNVVEADDVDNGDLLVVRDEDENCRPHRLRDPLPGEFLGRDPDTGRAAWLQGAVISGGEVPFGVPVEFWGTEASVPANYALCYGQLMDIADAPMLFAVIQHNANGGVDPGGGQFRIPDKRGYVTAGRDNMGGASANRLTAASMDVLGGTTGGEGQPIAVGNLPPHTHPLTINGAGTGISINGALTGVSIVGAGTGISIVGVGGHTHPGGSAGRSFVMANNAGIAQVHVAAAGHVAPPNDNDRIVVGNGEDPGHGPSQLNNANTGLAGDHSHGVSDPGHGHGVSDPTHGHGVSDPGHGHTGTANANANQTNTPLPIVQPTQAANYIIRLY